MRCPDVEAKVEHKPHWHVVRAAGITFAQGECPGYSPKCTCTFGAEVDRQHRETGSPNPARPLNICPVHRPRLYAMRLRNAEEARRRA